MQNGKRYLVLRNADGKETGYLAGDKHTAGSPLYVNSNNNAQKLKLKMIDGNAEFAHITYKFIYRGEEKGTEEYYMPVGVALPGIQTIFPDYITCSSVPSGNIDNSCNGKIYEINLYDELPFQVSDSYENAVWYYMNMRSTGSETNKPNKWVVMSDSEPYTNEYGAKNTTDEAKWAFIGNPYDGFTIINKAAGSAKKTLSLNDDEIVMREGQKVWNLQKGTGGFVLQAEKNTNIYAHDHNGSFKTWDSGSAKTDPGSAFNVIDVRSDALEYTTNVTLGNKITNLASITDGQTVVFKSVPHSKYINVSTSLETGISSTLSGLSVFKIHIVGDNTSTFTFESCKEGYYFPDITNGGQQNCTMTETPNQYSILSTMSDGTALSDGQFVIKSNGTNGGYFDVHQGSDFCGWQGKDTNCKYEIYAVTALGTTSAGTVNHCVLTDDNSNIYQFDYWALPGTTPSISGVPSSYITNGSMNNKTYTAHVSFPFPASSANQVNPTMISNGNWERATAPKKWHAVKDGEKYYVKVQTKTKTEEQVPSLEDMSAWQWAIYPKLIDGTFSFNIKNIATETYVYADPTIKENYKGDNKPISLSATGTDFSIVNGERNIMHFSYIADGGTQQRLTINSEDDVDVFLGSYKDGHAGNDIRFPAQKFSVTIPADGIATLFTPYAVSIPDGVTVKYVKASENQNTTGNIVYAELPGTIPANTAVLLEGNTGDYTFNVVDNDVDALEDNILFGYSKNTTVSTSDHTANVHSLTEKNGRIGFFAYDGDEYKAFTAYLDITSLNAQGTVEYLKVFDYFTLQTQVDGWTNNNPNTHLGTITLTNGGNVVAKKLQASSSNNYYYRFINTEGAGLELTRKYRGYDFLGFWLGETELGKNPTLTTEQANSVTEENPIIAKYRPTEEVTLFYDDDPFSYRIPAIGKTSTGRLIAVSDYRYSLDDIGRYNFGTANPGIDLVMRYSDDKGKTWSETKTIAKGSCVRGTDDCAYGDAAIAVVGQKVLVMGAAGDVMFGNGSATAHNRAVRIFSEDNGETWTKQDISETLFIGDDATIKNGYTAFFGSGLLAVDENYNNTGNARIYGAMLIRKEGVGNAIYVIYTDDFGLTWSILGGNQDHVTTNDEPKVEILPSGQILLSVRRGGGRQFNVFTYSDKATNAGTWGNNVNGCSNGGSNTCNGEIYVVDAKKADGSPVKLLLQSQPKGGGGLYDRRDVTIWYKEITDATYTSSEIAGNWIQGMQVSTQQSSYSTMVLQDDGKIAFFFEEAPCYDDDYTKGYSMVYVPLTVESITKGNYFSSNADLNTPRNIKVVLTDAEGNVYKDELNASLTGIGTALTTQYPFITLGNNVGINLVDESYTYTNTVTLTFKVSNENGTYWHNIYIPTYDNSGRYPVYFYATSNTDETVKIKKEKQAYGNSSFNTKSHADNMSWAIYSVNKGFAFTFKNKLTDKFIKVTTSASGSSDNVEYGNEQEATAFEIKNKTNSNHKGDYIIEHGEAHLSVCSSQNDDYLTFYKGDEHYGSTVKIVEAPDFDALIDEANAVLNLFGDGLGQYSNISEENLTAINEAKSEMEDAGTVKLNTLNEYKGYASKTTGATLNLPETGKFYYIQSANTNQYLSNVKSNTLTTTADKSANNIFYFESDGENTYLVAYENGHYVTNPWNIGVGEAKIPNTNEQYKQSKSFVEGQVGKYALKYFSNTGSTHFFTASENSTDQKTDKKHNEAQWNLEPVTSLPFTFKAAALGFATFCAPVNVKIPNDVTAYVAEIQGNTLKMRKFVVEDGENLILPAETPVMLYKADYLTEATIELLIVDGEYTLSKEDANKNDFVGTIAAKNLDDTKFCYSLQVNRDDSNKVGFYSKTTGTKGGFKAWIETEKSQGTQAFTIFFDGDDATGLKEALGIENENVEIYDLSGRRLDKPTKGINIVGGKLVIK